MAHWQICCLAMTLINGERNVYCVHIALTCAYSRRAKGSRLMHDVIRAPDVSFGAQADLKQNVGFCFRTVSRGSTGKFGPGFCLLWAVRPLVAHGLQGNLHAGCCHTTFLKPIRRAAFRRRDFKRQFSDIHRPNNGPGGGLPVSLRKTAVYETVRSSLAPA